VRLTRVYSRAPLESGHVALLSGPSAEHVARVLRRRAGDALTVFDGRGGEFDARIESVGRPGVRITVGEHHNIERESPVGTTLLQGVSRGERMDFVVQKATELGVHRIVPVETERSVVRLDAAARTRRRDRWNAVAESACEQCGRNRIPEISEPCSLDAALGRVSALPVRVLLDPLATEGLSARLTAGAREVAVLIGPEGGLTEEECRSALAAGFDGCSLGPRILRTETAALAILVAIQSLAGDLGGSSHGCCQ
jgi:16S rRNA (uracil1498-N3)-methyltransferase